MSEHEAEAGQPGKPGQPSQGAGGGGGGAGGAGGEGDPPGPGGPGGGGGEGADAPTLVERLSHPHLAPFERLVLLCGAVAATANLLAYLFAR